MKYTTVIFDLDGTLLNTLEDLADGVNYIMAKYGYPVHTLEEIRCFVGNGIRKLMERATPMGVENPMFEQIFRDFKEYYTSHCQVKTHVYPGIIELLHVLRTEYQCKMAIVSNKNMEAVQELNQIYFSDSMDLAVGEQKGVRKKPFPDEVETVIQELEAEKHQVLYVGDSEVDKETADNAGIDCVLVSWGFRDKEKLIALRPLGVIDTPEELLDYICGIN